ncbi:ABC transporter permease [Pollutibacter soli]|uniref:ABC transporter permease n=1 Tax=Pollutibacter soli TaxID=3034157 RepID=UPI0030135831
MFTNYIKIAWRTLKRNKLYSVLNIAGLCFGTSCFLLVGLYLFDELTFDEQHSKADRIYRVVEDKMVKGENTITAGAGYKLAEESKTRVTGVENTARMIRMGRANLVNPENPVNFQETVTAVNNSFLEIFDFPFVEGNRLSALTEPNSIIINEDLAMRLFNRKSDLLGKSLTFNFLETPLKITGVFKNMPRNSSLDFNCMMSEATFTNGDFFKQLAESDWLSNNFSVYVLLKPNAKPASVSKQLSEFVRKNFTAPAGTSFSYTLQPLKDIHLYSENIIDGARNSNVSPIAKGSIYYIRIFAFVAFFVLIIAGINYMNLTTARASGRLKEIGVRKSIGALRNHLTRQFLLESLLVTFIAFIFSIGLVNLLLPAFNQFTGKALSLGVYTDYRIWLLAVLFALGTGLLAGSYPALMLSRFRPAILLKGIKLRSQGDLSLRKGLVIFQFAISIVMIIGTIVLVQQVRYLNNTHLGFNKDLLVVIDVNTSKARSNFEAIKSDMAAIPSVKNVSVTSRVPGEWKTLQTIKVRTQGNTEQTGISYMFGADKDFLKTFEVQLIQGRNFSSPADSSSILINETAAKMLGITTASGQTVEIPEVNRYGGTFTPVNNENVPFTPTVVGIVRDFHFQSLRDKIEPLVLTYNHNPLQLIDYYSVRIDGSDIQGTLEKLKAIMVSNDKEEPFEYHFLDEQLALFYTEDARRQTLLIWMAFASIFIACLGLFGLATYSAEQRIKEIGVRKVLGASVFNVSSLLSKDFLKLVLIANGIAFPVAWWAINRWLQEYAYHVDIEWWVFVFSGCAAIAIALLTVSFQSIRAAMMNPVKSLRTE